MTISDMSPHSRGAMRPSRAKIFRPIEGVGNAGCLRTRSRAWCVESTRVSHHESTGNHPAFPHANGFNGFLRALSPAIGLYCHRRLADTSAKLDAGVEASGPHDFAVRVRAVRPQRARVHRIPCPTSVTIAKRPSQRAGMARGINLICPIRERESFCGRDWTGEISLIRFNKFAPARKRVRLTPPA